MWPSAHPQMPVRAYFASFHSINSLTPCRAYSIQRTHKGQQDAGPWRHQRLVGKRKHGTQLQPKPKLITLPPASLTEHTLPAWHIKAKMMSRPESIPPSLTQRLGGGQPWPHMHDHLPPVPRVQLTWHMTLAIHIFWSPTEIKKPHKGIKHCHLQRRG